MVLKKHWPNVPIYGDIRKLTYEKLKEDGIANIDILTGGFPCQDISCAGKGKGITGSKSGLWQEYARLIDEIRPKYAIVENVAALLNNGFSRVLGDLAEIGYDAEWHCIPASTVGAPHRRDRIWIVACNTNSNSQNKVKEIQRGKASECNGIGSNDPLLFWDKSKPPFPGVENGFSGRVDQLKQLGNAVVPQIPYLIGRAIMELEETAPLRIGDIGKEEGWESIGKSR